MITDCRINERGELEGKVEMPQWDEMYTKDEVIAMLEELNKKFDKQYYINRHELHDDSLNRGLEQGQNIIRKEIELLMENTDETNN